MKKFKPNNNLVKPKKKLGQHFLNSSDIAKQIVDCIDSENIDSIIEVGPGMGILTQHIIGLNKKSYFVEIDSESVKYLKENYPLIKDSIIEEDFLTSLYFKFFFISSLEELNKKASFLKSIPRPLKLSPDVIFEDI